MNERRLYALTEQFEAAMDCLGPFEPRPRLAVAVSGGADSMALALLTREWAARHHGDVLALTVDHGLRPEASGEADLTLRRLAVLGLAGCKLTVAGLTRGPGVAERAREARYRVLLDACAAANIPHLLLGHQRSDQVETVMMRALSGSASRGLAAMPVLLEGRFTRLLRPLLEIAPGQLRSWLTGRGVAWIEDPSNRDPLARRARLRASHADPGGGGEGTIAVAEAARHAGAHRQRRDNAIAGILARRATIRPEGYALLTPGPIEPEALAALLRTIAGAPFAPPIDRVARIARRLGQIAWRLGPATGPATLAGATLAGATLAGATLAGATLAGATLAGATLAGATLGGVRITPAGRLGPGWLLVRERRAMAGAVAACPNVVWDGRFRLTGAPPGDFADPLSGRLALGALGSGASRFRNRRGPPTLVLHGLPALWLDGMPIAVPHIGIGDPRWRVLFDPGNPASGAPFMSS